MKIALWILQVLLAAVFGMAGAMKTFTPTAELLEQMPLASESTMWAFRAAGISELLGAAGLILPAATRILPSLTPIAAACLAFVMVLAAGFHIMVGDFAGIIAPTVLGLLCAFVSWGRTVAAPIKA